MQESSYKSMKFCVSSWTRILSMTMVRSLNSRMKPKYPQGNTPPSPTMINPKHIPTSRTTGLRTLNKSSSLHFSTSTTLNGWCPHFNTNYFTYLRAYQTLLLPTLNHILPLKNSLPNTVKVFPQRIRVSLGCTSVPCEVHSQWNYSPFVSVSTFIE